jgi:hypothetical protein
MTRTFLSHDSAIEVQPDVDYNREHNCTFRWSAKSEGGGGLRKFVCYGIFNGVSMSNVYNPRANVTLPECKVGY